MDEKQKEELKAKAKDAANVTAKAIGKFSRWSLKKGKEGVAKYQEWSEEQAEKKRLEDKRQAIIAENNLKREKQEAAKQHEKET